MVKNLGFMNQPWFWILGLLLTSQITSTQFSNCQKLHLLVYDVGITVHVLHINAKWYNDIKYLKHWLSDKCQITLVFLEEVLLSSLSTHWRLRFLNSSYVPQLGSLLPLTEPHIWLCTEKRIQTRHPTHLPRFAPHGPPLGAWVGPGCY